MQPQQLMLLTFQYSELAQYKQPQMIAKVLMGWNSFKAFPKKFQNDSWLVDGHEV